MTVHPMMNRVSGEIAFVYYENNEPCAEVYEFHNKFGLVTHYLAIGLTDYYIKQLEAPGDEDQFLLARAIKMAKRHFDNETVYDPTRPDNLKEVPYEGEDDNSE